MSEKQMSLPGITEVAGNTATTGPRTPRPSIHDTELRNRWLTYAADTLAESGCFDDMDAEEIESALEKAHIRPGQDGFDAAKDFERAAYTDLDFDAAEALNNLDSGYQIENEAVKAWVIAYGIKPKLSVGDQFKHRNDRMVVVQIDEATAKYGCYVLADGEDIPANMTPLEIFAKYHIGGPGNKTRSLRIVPCEDAEKSL